MCLYTLAAASLPIVSFTVGSISRAASIHRSHLPAHRTWQSLRFPFDRRRSVHYDGAEYLPMSKQRDMNWCSVPPRNSCMICVAAARASISLPSSCSPRRNGLFLPFGKEPT